MALPLVTASSFVVLAANSTSLLRLFICLHSPAVERVLLALPFATTAVARKRETMTDWKCIMGYFEEMELCLNIE